MTPNEEIIFLKVTVTLLALVLGFVVWGLWRLRKHVERMRRQLEQQPQKLPQQSVKG